MHRLFVTTLLAVPLWLAGCDRQVAVERPAEVAPSASEDIAARPAMELSGECVNRVEGYSVRYPAGWRVNDGVVLSSCSLFDPDPIEVPRDSEIPLDFAIQIGFEPAPFGSVAGEVMGRRILTRNQTTVDGREAIRIEGEETGEGLHDRGIRSYVYLVDLGDSIMRASTYSVGTLPFDQKRRILDAMMATFDFRQPG